MANNRMYLRCKACGEMIFLGKRLVDGYWIQQYPQWEKPFMDMLNDFYDEHTYCNGEGEDCFEIHYEITAEYNGSNADRIRSMSDEELANMWCTYVDCGECPKRIGCSMNYQDCLRLALDYLKQEAQE